MRIFVMLGHGRSFARWAERFECGEVNDETPYSYGRAATMGCEVVSSTDRPEGAVGGFLRRGLSSLLGFDVVHVVHNLPQLREADVVWTHTEREHLAVCLLRLARPSLPPVLAKSIWLMDEWPTLSAPRRALFRALLSRAACLAFDSPLNAERARAALPGLPVVFVPFGVETARYRGEPRTSAPEADRPLRLLCVGNDTHRDWDLVARIAEQGGPAVEILVLAGRTASLARLDGTSATVTRARTVQKVSEAYAWSDVVLLPLRANMHVSGITVALEAVSAGRPVVSTRTGGLDSYFPHGEVTFLDPGSRPEDYLAAARRVASDVAGLSRQASAARARVEAAGLTGDGNVRRRVAVSRLLLARGNAGDSSEAAELAAPSALWTVSDRSGVDLSEAAG